ncbi:hypothetical protein QQ045_019577 [Rhodiola kirilowii]
MTVYKFPEKSIYELSRMFLNFWWDKKSNKGISWVNQKVLQLKKEEGGMGFRYLKAFNDAVIMKICWRMMKYPNLLMSQLLKARYCPDGSFWNARMGSNHSQVWRGVMKVMDIFKVC